MCGATVISKRPASPVPASIIVVALKLNKLARKTAMVKKPPPKASLLMMSGFAGVVMGTAARSTMHVA